MSRLTNFGEMFASKTLAKTYAAAVLNAIVNRNYEGDIQGPGDRVNILSFLNDGTLGDYVTGTDMSSEAIVDTEEQLTVEKRKYFNFSIDRLEEIFVYADDIVDHVSENYAKVLERSVDTYVLDKAPQAAVQNWVGTNLLVLGSGQTMASITTTATGGTITVNANDGTIESQIGSVENPLDGNLYFGGFDANDVGKGVRLVSTRTFVSPWYRITAASSSTVATITEWDGAVSGSDFKEGFTLRGIYGGDGRDFPKTNSGDQSWMIGGTQSGLGWEFQAAIATSVSASSIYDQTTLLAEKLDEAEVADTDRKLTVPPAIKTGLLQASELQPTGIAEIFAGTVIQGRVMRFGGFDVHVAAGSRVSTRTGHTTVSASGPQADIATSDGSVGYQILANHIGFMTFADKWAESRVVEAENQFAKKYQGLFLYGALVPAYRRKYGAILFGNF